MGQGLHYLTFYGYNYFRSDKLECLSPSVTSLNILGKAGASPSESPL